MIGAGPHVSTFRFACLIRFDARARAMADFASATVWLRAVRADTSSTLDRKRSGFEAKTLRVALKGVESLLLDRGAHTTL